MDERHAAPADEVEGGENDGADEENEENEVDVEGSEPVAVVLLNEDAVEDGAELGPNGLVVVVVVGSPSALPRGRREGACDRDVRRAPVPANWPPSAAPPLREEAGKSASYPWLPSSNPNSSSSSYSSTSSTSSTARRRLRPARA